MYTVTCPALIGPSMQNGIIPASSKVHYYHHVVCWLALRWWAPTQQLSREQHSRQQQHTPDATGRRARTAAAAGAAVCVWRSPDEASVSQSAGWSGWPRDLIMHHHHQFLKKFRIEHHEPIHQQHTSLSCLKACVF